MRIPKQAVITDEFKCPKYWPDLKPIQYKVCLGRQITKLAGGGNQYPECVGCVSGMTITKHFKDYQPIPKRANKCNWNTDLKLAAANKEKKKRAKIGEVL